MKKSCFEHLREIVIEQHKKKSMRGSPAGQSRIDFIGWP